MDRPRDPLTFPRCRGVGLRQPPWVASNYGQDGQNSPYQAWPGGEERYLRVCAPARRDGLCEGVFAGGCRKLRMVTRGVVLYLPPAPAPRLSARRPTLWRWPP